MRRKGSEVLGDLETGGEGFENIGNMNRHLPYCPVLKSGQAMALSPNARMGRGGGSRDRDRGGGDLKAQDDGEEQQYRPPRVGERFQASVSGQFGTGVGRTPHYPANFNVSEKQRDDRKRYSGDGSNERRGLHARAGRIVETRSGSCWTGNGAKGRPKGRRRRS